MLPEQNVEVPEIISMEVDHENEDDSEYRLQIGSQVKYLKITPGTFDSDELSFPINSLPSLPYQDGWTIARISRDAETGRLKTSFTDRKLAAVQNVWHTTQISVLDLKRTEQLTAAAFEAILPVSAIPGSGLIDQSPSSSSRMTTVVAKIARFEWEVPRIEQETRAYQVLQQQQASDLAPRFLGHVHENGRVMGFVLEKLEEMRHASLGDLKACESALGKFHSLGLLHGDVNRYNFLIGKQGSVTLLDFERFEEDASEESRAKEMQSLQSELIDVSGRGAGFVFRNEDN